MLVEYVKRSWVAYLSSLAVFSIVLALVFTATTGGSGIADMAVMTVSILVVVVPVTFILAMPLAFWAWREQQRRRIKISPLQAGMIGLSAGMLLHTLFVMCFGGWMALPQVLLFTLFCGGGYGLTFALFFFYRGGLELADGEGGADQAAAAVESRTE